MECEATKQQRKQEEHTESQKMHIDAIREQNRRLHELYLELQRLEHQNRIESIETRVELKRLSNKCKVEERKRKTIDAITAIKAKIREAEEMLKAKVKSEEASNGA
jgi:TolA-binding protein